MTGSSLGVILDEDHSFCRKETLTAGVSVRELLSYCGDGVERKQKRKMVAILVFAKI